MTTLPLAGAVGQSKRTDNQAHTDLNALYREIGQGKGINFTGQTRKYTPLVDGSAGPPDEEKAVGLVATEVLARIRDIMTPAFDANYTRDVGNTRAAADIVINGKTLLANVPASHLIWLEKKIANLLDVAAAIPVLPLGIDWQPAGRAGLRQSPEKVTQRHGTEPQYKLSRPIPEKGIPEQLLDKFTAPVVLGHWHERSYTGALPHQERQDLLSRIRALLEAIKAARIKANGLEVEKLEAGAPIMNWVLDGELPAG